MKKKILLIRLSSLGDVVLTTSVPANIKLRHPDAEIVVLTRTEYAPLFANNPHVDRVLGFDRTSDNFGQIVQDVRREKFEIIIDLHGNIRSFALRLLAGPPVATVVEKLAWLRWKLVLFKRKDPRLNRSVRERILDTLALLEIPVVDGNTHLYPKNVDETLKRFKLDPTKKLIGIAPGAKHNTKRWPVERFIDAANRMGALPNSEVILIGSADDARVAEQVAAGLRVPYKNLAGQTGLLDLINVMSKFSFLITNDSGILHMAEALAIPLVAIFGPTVRAFGFAPYRPTSRVVEVINLPCRPCTLHGDPVCPLKHHLCMKDVDINAVMFAASASMDNPEIQAGCCQT